MKFPSFTRKFFSLPVLFISSVCLLADQKEVLFFLKDRLPPDEHAVREYADTNKKKPTEQEKKEEKEAVLQLLAETYEASGEPDKAINLYKQILSQNPAHQEARKALAQLLTWHKMYPEAISEYMEVLRQNPNDMQAKRQLAETYKFAHMFDQAENLYTKSLQEDPENADLYADLGELLTWERRYTEALACFEKAKALGESKNTELLYAQAILYSGNPQKAQSLLLALLQQFPDDRKVRIALADSYAFDEQFHKAIPLYKKLLEEQSSVLVQTKLAEALSWNRDYDESIALYDTILDEQYSTSIQRQKARVLGWAQKYDRAEAEYKAILQKEYNRCIDLEMQSKVAYWNDRWIMAEKRYKELIALEPENVEALFDLSQIYSHRLQWQAAVKEYTAILALEPNHFRAKDGLSKVELLSEHVALSSGFRKFQAFSISRSTDIDKYQFVNLLSIPVNTENWIEVNDTMTKRYFIDYPHILEKEKSCSFSRVINPDSSITLHYGIIAYEVHASHWKPTVQPTTTQPSTPTIVAPPERARTRARSHPFLATKNSSSQQTGTQTTTVPLEPLHHKHFPYYGAFFSHRQSDWATYTVRFDKQRLENNSTVIVKSLYDHEFQGRVDINCSRDWKLGIEYLLAHYSDNNRLDQPGADVVYFLSKDPQRLYVQYRYYFMNFKKMRLDYWTPKNYSANCAAVGLRQYLNNGEVFFGDKERYYDLKYEIISDTTHTVQHRLRWEINWEINKKLSFNIRGNVLRSINRVYKENEFFMGLKYYF